MAEKIVVVVTKKPVEIKPGAVQPVEVKPSPSTALHVMPGEKSSVSILPGEKAVTDLTVVAQQGPPGPQGPEGPPGPQGPEGLRWRGKWDAGTSYSVDDAVEYGGSSYVATAPSLNEPPPLNPSKWDLLATVEAVDGGEW